MQDHTETIDNLLVCVTEKDQQAAELRNAEEVFSQFVKNTYQMSNIEFMRSMVSCLASLLKVRYTLISEITDSRRDKAQTIAVHADGKIMDNFEYDLPGTPCNRVFSDKSLCFYSTGVQNLFPNDHILKEMGIESYIGIPLYDSDQTILGVLISMNDKPVTNGLRAKTLMEVFSGRAAIELDRRKKNNELDKFKTIVKNSPAIVVVTDHMGIIEYVNPRFTEITGFTLEESLGTSIMDRCYLSPEDHKKMWEMIEKGDNWRGICQNTKKNGDTYCGYASVVAVKNESDKTINILKISIDISEQIEAVNTLRRSEARLSEAQRIAHLGNWDWDILNNKLWWSDEIYRIFGLIPNEFEANYESFLNAIHPEDLEAVKKGVDQALKDNKPYSIVHRIILKDGGERTVHEQAEVTFDDSGQPVRMAGTVHDVTYFKKTEHELKKLSILMKQNVNIVFITDPNGVIEDVNPMFEEITGYSSEDAVGKNPSILKSGETQWEEYKILWNTLKSGKTWRGIFKNRKKDGNYYWASNVVSPIINEKGEITNFLTIQEDITEKRKAEERIRHLIVHDTLTGLFNRKQFIHLMDCWMDEARVLNKKGALLLIDLDYFRFINEKYCHATGDMILNSVAAMLEETINEYYISIMNPSQIERYITAHLDSDEFAVFLPECDIKEGLAAAEKIRTAMENINLIDLPTKVTASIGISVYPRHGDNTSELLRRADIAIYKAKEMGKNNSRVYSPEYRELEKIHERLEWKERILSALNEDRFEPWFQPILDLTNGQITHYETLARMKDKDGKIHFPAAFIDVAERFKIISLIDKAIIRKSMRFQADIRRKGITINISMNLSGRVLGDEDFLGFIKSEINESGSDPNRIIFEITETEAVHNINSAITFIKEIRDIGCHFALDDFGVGFSSFLYLKMMEVDYIKIDGAFVKNLYASPTDQLFVKSIINVAKGMGIKTIAEFVETRETLDILREYGVDFVQGYFSGKPAPFGFKDLTSEPPIICTSEEFVVK